MPVAAAPSNGYGRAVGVSGSALTRRIAMRISGPVVQAHRLTRRGAGVQAAQRRERPLFLITRQGTDLEQPQLSVFETKLDVPRQQVAAKRLGRRILSFHLRHHFPTLADL